MHNNTMKTFFLSFLVMGSILSISSNSWLGVWMGLEINLLSFIPMLSSYKNPSYNEATIKYFIIQALASTMLLFSILLIQIKNIILWENNTLMLLLVASSLMLKIGAAPFHLWFPEVMSKTNWMNCIILMSWQKIAPMSVMSYCLKMNVIIGAIAIISMMVGALGGLNQTSLRKLMAYSSISHIGWMLSSMIISETMWELYFLVYSMLVVTIVLMFNQNKMFWLNQISTSNNENKMMKYFMFMSLLSLGGLPPFMGFLPKWMVIQSMLNNNLIPLISTMVIMTMITLYYYMRIILSVMVINHVEIKWNMMMNKSITSNNVMSYLVTMSSLMLMSTPTLLFMT